MNGWDIYLLCCRWSVYNLVQLHVSGINGATCGAGPVYSFGVHELTSGFSGVRVAHKLVKNWNNLTS
jgi:CxxC motif-containing protein